MFGKPVAAGVLQIEKSAPSNGGDMSMAVAPAPAMVTTFPASSVTSAAPPSAAAPVETSNLCDRVNVAMSYSKSGGGNLPNLRSNPVALAGIQRRPLNANFQTFPAFLQENCNVGTPRHLSAGERVLCGSAVLFMSALGSFASLETRTDHFQSTPEADTFTAGGTSASGVAIRSPATRRVRHSAKM
jgi:hypothetical protein